MKIGTYKIEYKAITEDGIESNTAVLTLVVVRSTQSIVSLEDSQSHLFEFGTFLSDTNLKIISQMNEVILNNQDSSTSQRETNSTQLQSPTVKLREITLSGLVKVRFSEEIILLSKDLQTKSNNSLSDEE